MVELLPDRFTPIQIQSVQSSLFHDRKQTNETVDEYALDVQRLFYLVYLQAQQGTKWPRVAEAGGTYRNGLPVCSRAQT